MEFILKTIKSRTFWTIVVMFVIGGVQAVEPIMPNGLYLLISSVLASLATYFKLNPSQRY